MPSTTQPAKALIPATKDGLIFYKLSDLLEIVDAEEIGLTYSYQVPLYDGDGNETISIFVDGFNHEAPHDINGGKLPEESFTDEFLAVLPETDVRHLGNHFVRQGEIKKNCPVYQIDFVVHGHHHRTKTVMVEDRNEYPINIEGIRFVDDEEAEMLWKEFLADQARN